MSAAPSQSYMPTMSTLAFVFLPLLAIATIAIHRLYFHPLACYPGPRLAAVTSLYHAYYDLVKDGGGEFLSQLEKLHQVYGPVVRFGPNDLHFSDPKAYPDIYRTGAFIVKEPVSYGAFNVSDGSFGQTDLHQHRARREILNPFFQRRATLQLEEKIQKDVHRIPLSPFIAHSSFTPNVPVNCYFAFRALTTDIIMSYTFGQTIGCLDASGFRHDLLVNISTLNHLIWISRWIPIIPAILARLPDALVLKLPSAQLRCNVEMRTMYARLIASHTVALQDNTKAGTIFSALLSSDEDIADENQHSVAYDKPRLIDDKQRSKKSLIDEAQVLTQAGGETVGQTCYVGIFHIINDPRVQRTLLAELMEAWPDKAHPPPLQDLERLPYLTACIKEALRLALGVCSPLQRLALKDIRVGDWAVPAGTAVSMGVTFLHFNPEIFPDPMVFKPERWLGIEPEAHAILEDNMVSFSRGTRQCVGMGMAWVEMYMIFGHLIRRLDMKAHNTSVEDVTAIKDFFEPYFRGRTFHMVVKPRE
ncbi:cytochrome P450 [Cylindrobasidium torrendii FP15055 ss-10]|uniref:Cytochrome P450 n=1 Tax=Cylindrobasidium torrendii FP15055 ss-10 TaxID=1314674 RepID=A0A0D7B5G0_9AGAR|nr:cytochrome P450 [Cylindrobasidium torrendii FP15055 ss-10]